jgi:hypothetical protein
MRSLRAQHNVFFILKFIICCMFNTDCVKLSSAPAQMAAHRNGGMHLVPD